MNMVEQIKGLLGGDLISKLASALGESPDAARTAMNAAVPTMLAGVAGVASSPEGARRLASAVEQQDDSLLDNITGMFSGQKDSLMQKGGSVLNSLFGGSALTGLTGALSKFTGLGGRSMTSLLAMLAPVALGFLRKQQRTQGLDASGLSSLLIDQRENIAAGMPVGLAAQLRSVPGLDKLGFGQPAAAPALHPAYASAAVGTAPIRTTTRERETARPSVLRWLLPLLILGLAAWLLYSIMNRGTTRQEPVREAAPQRAVVETPAVGVAALSTDLRTTFGSLTDTFSNITDSTSAQAALPKVRDLTARLGDLQAKVPQLTATERSTVASTVSSLRAQLQPVIDRVLGLPGVASVLQPAVDALMQKFDAFSSA